MYIFIVERSLAQILYLHIELDLDLRLISRAIDLDAIDHVSLSRLYGNPI